MENSARENTVAVGLKAILRELFKPEIDGTNEGNDEVDQAFKEVSKRIEVKEKRIRVGETMAKVRGKNSVKGMPTFSKEKSVNIQKAQMKKGKGLEKSDHKQAIMSEDREIAK